MTIQDQFNIAFQRMIEMLIDLRDRDMPTGIAMSVMFNNGKCRSYLSMGDCDRIALLGCMELTKLDILSTIRSGNIDDEREGDMIN